MKIIAVSGTPGTGKTTLSKELAEKFGFKYVDVSDLIEEKGICEGYDEERKCRIVDTDLLNEELEKLIKENEKEKGLVIDSHLSHHMKKESVDLCIITKSELKELEARLKERGYDEAKVRENLDSEIFDICLTEAQELGHNVLEVYTNESLHDEYIAKIKASLNL